MTLRRWFAAGLAGLAIAAPAAAQDRLLDLLGASGLGRPTAATTPNPLGNLPMTGPVDPAEYMVGPGDLLQVHLKGGVTRNWDLVVLPDGSLFVPSVGAIPVSGATLLEAKDAIVQRIAREYKNVETDVRLARPRIMLVQMAGETRHNGPLEVAATSRATEVLSDTLFTRLSSTRNVEVRRRTPGGDLRIVVDVQRMRLTGRTQRDPLLRDGDVLFVPVATGSVGIEGAVGRPGYYELAAGDSLGTLFEMVGGTLVESSDQATLVRFRDATHADTLGFHISDVRSGRFDLPLRDGDRVFVYFQARYHLLERATVLGEVQRPGVFPLAFGIVHLSDLLTAAGGFLPHADLTTLRVYRVNPKASEGDAELDRLAQLSRQEMTASEYEVLRARLAARRADFRVDWNRVQGVRELDLILRDGDIVAVDPILASVRVDGEVRRPGLVAYEPGRRVSDYVRLVGGFSERAARGQVRITRAVTGQTILARDVPALAPGDLVWVPERGETASWQTIQSVLLVLAQIATVLLAVRR